MPPTASQPSWRVCDYADFVSAGTAATSAFGSDVGIIRRSARAQMEHLLQITTEPTTGTVQVLPFSVGEYPGLVVLQPAQPRHRRSNDRAHGHSGCGRHLCRARESGQPGRTLRPATCHRAGTRRVPGVHTGPDRTPRQPLLAGLAGDAPRAPTPLRVMVAHSPILRSYSVQPSPPAERPQSCLIRSFICMCTPSTRCSTGQPRSARCSPRLSG